MHVLSFMFQVTYLSAALFVSLKPNTAGDTYRHLPQHCQHWKSNSVFGKNCHHHSFWLHEALMFPFPNKAE